MGPDPCFLNVPRFKRVEKMWLTLIDLDMPALRTIIFLDHLCALELDRVAGELLQDLDLEYERVLVVDVSLHDGS